MVREIMHDEQFLSQKAEPAALEDLAIAQDLLETLFVHENGCVGIVNKRIIVFDNEGTYVVMFNPEIIKKIRTLSGGGALSVSLRRLQSQTLEVH